MDRRFDPSLDIFKEQTDRLYEKAGELVEEEENQISLTEHSHLLNDNVATIIEQVLEENPLPYSLQDFQKLALHAIGSLKNVILIREGFNMKKTQQCILMMKIFNFAVICLT